VTLAVNGNPAGSGARGRMRVITMMTVVVVLSLNEPDQMSKCSYWQWASGSCIWLEARLWNQSDKTTALSTEIGT